MPKLSGTISNEGILDLTWAQSEDDLEGITSFENIGVIRVPPHLLGFVSSIPRTGVGSIFPVQPGLKKELVGHVRITGDFLARGDPETILMVTGQLIVIPPVEAVGFKEINMFGQMILPRGSEGVISGKLGNVTGQISYIPWDKGTPRFFLGEDIIGREFLELLPEPAPWLIVGELTIEDDVTVEMLRSKVTEIVLVGEITTPKVLLPILQVLTTDKVGEFVVKD